MPVHPIIQAERKGLIALPFELFLEIVPYFSKIPTSHFPPVPDFHPDEYSQRFAALQALSQTCKELRGAFLPLAWERLEAIWPPSIERKSTGLLQSPHLIPHVRIATFTLPYQTVYDLSTVTECLQALTNLHTIQIMNLGDSEPPDIKTAFEGHTFPFVRTMAVPHSLSNILSHFPNVEDLMCNNYDDGNHWLYFARDFFDAVVAAKLTKLKTLRRVMMSESMGKSVAKFSPNLELIRVFHTWHESQTFEELRHFKNLDTIEFQINGGMDKQGYAIWFEKQRTYMIQIGRDVLKASKSTRKKHLRLLYGWPESEDILL